jgi:CBS domain-containing protein
MEGQAMLTLRHIMTPDVITVAPDTPLAEVAQLMATEGISGVPVVSAARIVGVVSASDIMDFNATDMGERAEHGRGGVFDNYHEEADAGVPAFFIDPWPGSSTDGSADDDGDDDDPYGEFTAADIMTRTLFALAPETAVEDAARFMLQRGIHRVLIVEDGRLAGIATSMDFVRLVADQLVPATA